MATAQKPRITLDGLAPLLDLDQLDDTPPREEPPRMALDLIDEDPNQPRQEFDSATLQELADSIKASGGVKSPVSLRPHPTVPGRYMLNFGARRLRASRLLGLPDIPYFIDRQVDSFDQVIENEQRDGLKPMELALFIKARLAEGMSQQEIAQRLGKSKALVSQATALIDPPDCLMDAYRSGRLRGLTDAYELRKLHRDYPEAVEQWTAAQKEITRPVINRFRAELEAPAVQSEPAPVAVQTAHAQPPAPTAQLEKAAYTPPFKAAPAPVAAGQTAKPAGAVLVLVGDYKGQPLELDLSAKPPTNGHIYGRRPGSPRRLTVPAAEVKLVGFAAE
ncbi:ParB/RepB/Spo0J family partition protein [Azohydromonas australica]|uniref:ParB/RepB/Spo0J family partition protein n=1 Tax=Azohydromonas australica TaxID=364039 RepID=UPI00048A48EE|nr:ParB/RepB/Spo0J family partition protein [Azohydromonas australica]